MPIKVLTLPADYSGCGYYRVIWPARAVAAQSSELDIQLGKTVLCGYVDDQEMLPVRYSDGTKGMHNTTMQRLIYVDLDAEVVVMQRPLKAETLANIALLKENGIAVVIDIDDDFMALDPANPAFWASHQNKDQWSNRSIMRQALKLADLITVSTPTLQRLYPGSVLIRNYVPKINLSIDRVPNEVPVVGWSGLTKYKTGDLPVVGPSLSMLTGATFSIVGDGTNAWPALGVTGTSTERIVDLESGDYAKALAEFDLGFVPLAITRFNQSKSWIKGLEMASVGVPFVASPTESYLTLEANGIGQTAKKPKHWRATLQRLIDDPMLRLDESYRIREIVAESWTIEDHAHEWEAAWKLALDRQKQNHAFRSQEVEDIMTNAKTLRWPKPPDPKTQALQQLADFSQHQMAAEMAAEQGSK
jgi:hypothetical protein